MNKLVQVEKAKLNKTAQTMSGTMRIFGEAKRIFGDKEVTSLRDAIDFLASRRATQKYKAMKKNVWHDDYFGHQRAARLGWRRRKEGRPTLAQLERDWINVGYTKPTARSMAILDDAIEKAEGHPGRGSLFPWSVRLLKSAAKRLGLKSRFICRATKLHKVAEKWQRIKKPSRVALAVNLRKCKNNPPRRAVLIYDNILSIEAAKGKKSLWPREKFKHDFKAKKGKAAIYGLPDGSLLIKGKKPLWKKFNYPNP